MPDEMMSNEQAGQILEQVLQRTRAAEGVPSKEALCKIYKEVKPLIERLLAWVEKLPNGKQIASLIRFLMKIADLLCP